MGVLRSAAGRDRELSRGPDRGSRRRQQPRGRRRPGTRKVPFSRVLYIERDDFREDPPKKFFRLAPGREVRLRCAYFITCTGVVKDPATGEITELRCTYDPATRGGDAPDGRKVKATLHWVSAAHAVDAEVRLYDRLFNVRRARARSSDYRDDLNPGVARSRADAQGRAVRRRRRAGHALPVRAARLLLRRPRQRARTAGVQPHRDAEGHLGEGSEQQQAFRLQGRNCAQSNSPAAICSDQLVQRPHPRAVGVRAAGSPRPAARRAGRRCARRPRPRCTDRRRGSSWLSPAPLRSSAISKKRGSGFSTPSSAESSTTSKRGVRPSRSRCARSVPLAFDTTTIRRPRARSASSAGRTAVGHVLPEVAGRVIGVQLGQRRGRAVRARDAGVREDQVEEAASRGSRRSSPPMTLQIVELAPRVRVGG